MQCYQHRFLILTEKFDKILPLLILFFQELFVKSAKKIIYGYKTAYLDELLLYYFSNAK